MLPSSITIMDFFTGIPLNRPVVPLRVRLRKHKGQEAQSYGLTNLCIEGYLIPKFGRCANFFFFEPDAKRD